MKQPIWRILVLIILTVVFLSLGVAQKLGINVRFLGGNKMPSFAYLEEEVQNYVPDPIKPVEADFEARIVTIDLLDEKIEEIILDKLALCESGNRADIKVLDTNNKYSFGVFQFQLETFWGFGVQYGILSEGIELAEAENLIYDPEIQRDLALEMVKRGLLEDHWKVCASRLLQNEKGTRI